MHIGILRIINHSNEERMNYGIDKLKHKKSDCIIFAAIS